MEGSDSKSVSGTVQEKPANYKRISDDDLYRHSSQYRFWSFTPEQLEQKRIDTNAQAVVSVEERLSAFRDENNADLTEEEVKTLLEKAVPVTMEEEVKLVNFYAKKVQGIAQHMNLPTEVVATSLTFFRRFYLENSVMDIDPKTIVHTTIFLACKSENYFISVDSFAKKTKSVREAILKHEFKLLESLKFSLLNHHPYRPLHGFFLDIQNLLTGKVDIKYMGQIYENCKKRITEALLTDAIYFYTPPQITLAALLLEDEALTLKYLETKFKPKEEEAETETEVDEKKKNKKVEDKDNSPKEDKPESSINYDVLLSLILACKEKIIELPSVTMDDAKNIAAKLYFCNNPMKAIANSKRKQEESVSDSGEKKQKI
ncbi:hypothetical protein Kpol_1045p10 [Vanderwaltozyma polyspora DSM 70294]|uniref:Cyclin-like domain-containing protein n=1 Tax=Vanderwaltozyma polyspora (strain ATCC 22028 / DSM 70294 / BCRC 21397 / CBS 2163 / NBRC 10782 / NRRL Y-8283 / UCD 57-17) TaxID=436907 RepID=A7TI19_VANPO|nr:uncharacterized protein Kpol_1045p10 [Vanderwaltozyma polyspora DSM 70294]EDO18026.1 hypothetical protein Kpol_1045p10 [Vanderwaltozyma polyspora DSM 70294]